jgi:hypothetical protein
LEGAIVGNPAVGDVIPGLGGLRKLRFGLGGQGKRGGGRAIYFVMVAEDAAALLCAYAKSTQADLTADQRRAVLALMRELTDDET